MSSAKPKFRMAPPPEGLIAQQAAVQQQLDKLEPWSVAPVPVIDPPEPAPAKLKPLPKAKAPPKAAEPPAPAPEPPKQPWQSVAPEATHPYYVIISEALFQKLDFAWKRTGQASMKTLVIKTLTDRADAILKELGEKP